MWDSLITYKHQITQGFLTEPERFLYWSYRDWLLSNKLRWKHLKLGEMNGMQVTRHYKSWPHAYYKNLIVDCVGKTRAFYKPLSTKDDEKLVLNHLISFLWLKFPVWLIEEVMVVPVLRCVPLSQLEVLLWVYYHHFFFIFLQFSDYYIPALLFFLFQHLNYDLIKKQTIKKLGLTALFIILSHFSRLRALYPSVNVSWNV